MITNSNYQFILITRNLYTRTDCYNVLSMNINCAYDQVKIYPELEQRMYYYIDLSVYINCYKSSLNNY